LKTLKLTFMIVWKTRIQGVSRLADITAGGDFLVFVIETGRVSDAADGISKSVEAATSNLSSSQPSDSLCCGQGLHFLNKL
jgi:hypothetical protein